MKTLFLLRHAKSSWNDPNLQDFDRPLNARGRRAAELIGTYIREHEVSPELVMSSPAVRARETIEIILKNVKLPAELRFDQRIYEASPLVLIEVISQFDEDKSSVLLVGHNPGMEDLVFDIVPDDGNSPLRDVVWEKYPTGALARIELDIASWADIDRNTGRLTHFIRPRDLDPELGPEDE